MGKWLRAGSGVQKAQDPSFLLGSVDPVVLLQGTPGVPSAGMVGLRKLGPEGSGGGGGDTDGSTLSPLSAGVARLGLHIGQLDVTSHFQVIDGSQVLQAVGVFQQVLAVQGHPVVVAFAYDCHLCRKALPFALLVQNPQPSQQAQGPSFPTSLFSPNQPLTHTERPAAP